MQKKLFALVLVSAVTLVSSSVYSSNAETIQIVHREENEIMPYTAIHTDYNITTDNSTYTTSDFSTPSSNSRDINVSFTNDGSSSATVKLYKVGIFRKSLVGSFDVSSDTSDYATFSGSSKTTYSVTITNSIGTSIKGSLKVRQLD